MGAGQESFFNDDTNKWEIHDVVYFPMYAPVLTKKHQERVRTQNQAKMRMMNERDKYHFAQALEAIEDVKVDSVPRYELIKTKVRAVGQDNKRHQKTLPAGCQV